MLQEKTPKKKKNKKPTLKKMAPSCELNFIKWSLFCQKGQFWGIQPRNKQAGWKSACAFILSFQTLIQAFREKTEVLLVLSFREKQQSVLWSS